MPPPDGSKTATADVSATALKADVAHEPRTNRKALGMRTIRRAHTLLKTSSRHKIPPDRTQISCQIGMNNIVFHLMRRRCVTICSRDRGKLIATARAATHDSNDPACSTLFLINGVS